MSIASERTRVRLSVMLALAAIPLLMGCASLRGSDTQVFEQEVLRVPIRIEVREADSDRVKAGVEAAFERAEAVGKRLLAHRRTSHIGILNEFPPKLTIRLTDVGRVGAETAIKTALVTEGAYTPVRQPVLEVWGLTDGAPRVPSAQERAEAALRTNYDRFDVDFDQGNAQRLGQGTVIDLEGIAIGVMLDEALLAIHKQGVGEAMISSGEIYTAYWRGEASPWRVRVRGLGDDGNPTTVAEIVLNRRAFASVHPEEIFVAEDGTRIHEWIDPRTGELVEGVRVAGVFAHSAAIAAGLAAGAFVHGDEAPTVVERRQGAQWILWTDAQGPRAAAGVEVEWFAGGAPTSR